LAQGIWEKINLVLKFSVHSLATLIFFSAPHLWRNKSIYFHWDRTQHSPSKVPIMTLKVAQVAILGAACFVATNMVGCKDEDDDDCDVNACRCWDTGTAAVPNEDNIKDWAELAKFNTCCYKCGVDKLDCTPGDGTCTWENARDAFRACGAILPDTEPSGFTPP